MYIYIYIYLITLLPFSECVIRAPKIYSLFKLPVDSTVLLTTLFINVTLCVLICISPIHPNCPYTLRRAFSPFDRFYIQVSLSTHPPIVCFPSYSLTLVDKYTMNMDVQVSQGMLRSVPSFLYLEEGIESDASSNFSFLILRNLHTAFHSDYMIHIPPPV